MEVDEILQWLTDLESGARQLKPGERRFVLVEAEWDGKSSGTWAAPDDAVTWPEALDQLASKVNEHGSLLSEVDDDGHPLLATLRSPERKNLAQVLLGLQEHLRPQPEPLPGNPFIAAAVRSFPASHPMAAVIGDEPDGSGFARAVLELAPTGEPDAEGLALLNAAARGDLAAIEAALTAGADVNTLDTNGMTPLHHAVARRDPEAVETLLRSGADPVAQAEYGNSVCFASLDEQRRVRPCAEQIEDDAHWGLIVALLEAGADVNARDPLGHTLTDLAIGTVPYPDRVVEHLRDQGGTPVVRATVRLPEFLRELRHECEEKRWNRINEVRYLLDTHGVDPDALHHLLHAGWSEVDGVAEVLFELTDLLLSYGAEDTLLDGITPLDRAFEHLGNGQRPHYQVVTYRLRKAGFTRSLRGLLEWLPDGDAKAQRARIAEVRERLETEGPQADTLRWLLSLHGWYEHEIDGETFGELIDVLLEHGGENTAVNGRTPLGWARFWLDRGDHRQYRVVVDRLLAAGFTYSVRDFLDRIPKGDTEDQREYLVELRERLEVDGPQPDALHWLLSPNSKWTENEVSGEILEELTDLLLAHGARDGVRDDSRPLDRALNRVNRDELENYLPVVNRLKAAGFKTAG